VPIIQTLCVFCGSSNGVADSFVSATRAFARACVHRGIRVVYGGASVGLMGTLANDTLAAGGEIVGVIPRALVDREIAHPGLTALHVVETMHDRKALMARLADAFVALPGGLGTLEELFEVWTWGELGLHNKPYGVLDVDGYYAPLVSFLDHARDAGFIRARQRARLVVAGDADALLDALSTSSAKS
jgi:uncharacterized protein (TIGR00730 family)